MQEITVKELAARHAVLEETAARARAESRLTSGTSSRALFLARKARYYQTRADDYAAVLALVRTAGEAGGEESS